MKSLAMFALLFFSVSLSGQEVEWYKWNEGQKVALEQEKPILIFVHASWCHLCQRMDSKVFTDPQVSALINASFIAVKLDAETEETMLWEGKEISAGKLLAMLTGENFRGVPAYIFLPGNPKKKSHLEAGLKDVEEMKKLLGKYS